MDSEHVQTPDQRDTAYERIARQLAGEATDAERAELAASLADAEYRARYDDAVAHWAAATPEHVDVEAGWAKVQARLATHGQGEPASPRVLPFKAPWWRSSAGLMRAAAVGFVLVTAGILYSRIGTSGDGGGGSPAGASIVATTRVAERTVMNLPDGSQVHLGPKSSLRTLDGFGNGAREVELSGEAVFKVTHDAARPFRVRTAGAVIEDLGTEFVVRAVMEEPLRVAVSEGSVSVGRTGGAAGSVAVLNPRDVAILADTGEAIVQRNVDVDRYAAWARERVELIFDNTPLRSVFTELERWYDVEFDVTDPAVLTRTLNAPVAGVTIDQVLQVMNTALELRFERDGRIVRLAAPVRTGMSAPSPAQVGGGA
jgi:ferric-dicitrate binding protein FerR (iron transport regulator)